MSKVDLFRKMVSISDGEIVTTSRKIAEVFGKRHDNVISAIEKLDCSEDFRRLTYKVSQYTQVLPTGGQKEVKEYIMTKDGMAFLVMGFKGKEAAKFKEAYINAFNWMANKIHQRNELDRELNDFTRRESNSIASGSFHGKGLAQRRHEKSALAVELQELRDKIQMVLPELAAIEG